MIRPVVLSAKTMFKKILFTFILLFPLHGWADLTREEAKAALLKVVGNLGQDREVSIYLTATTLPAGSSIEPFINEGDPQILPAVTWFGWIDDNPNALFSHRTRFVYINASDGAVTVVNHEWWPELNGESIFSEVQITATPGLVIVCPRRERQP